MNRLYCLFKPGSLSMKGVDVLMKRNDFKHLLHKSLTFIAVLKT